MWFKNFSKDKVLEGIGMGIYLIFLLIRLALLLLRVVPPSTGDILWLMANFGLLYAYVKRGHQLPVSTKKKKQTAFPKP